MEHALKWVAPSPAWGRLRAPGDPRPSAFVAPTLLVFKRDDFMEALQQHLNPAPSSDGRPNEPGDLADFRLEWESAGLRPSGADPETWAPKPEAVPKLYHPAHGRFYLVAASLVCRLPGLPDHKVDTARGESVGCVLRRVRDDQEEAWIPASEPGKGVWKPVDADESQPDWYAHLAPGEELRPMFPVMFRRDGKPRRLWAALIPVASRETYTVPQAPPEKPSTDLDSDVLLAEPRARVRQGLAAIADTNTLIEQGKLDRASVAQMLELTARFFLVELAELLVNHLPAVLRNDSDLVPEGPQRKLRLALDELFSQLMSTWNERDRINGESPDKQPSTQIVLDSLLALAAPRVDPDTELRRPGIELLDKQIVAALRAAKADPPPVDAELPRFEDPDDKETRYVLRCVFRPHTCGPERPDLVSSASERFAMASFFDADAPARPIRISLPIDTSVLGLRKSPRNVAFILSSTLRKQMSRIGKFKDLIEGKLDNEKSFDLGEICSLSIPIITICALIVLFIFLAILHYIFWWLPFIKLCFPIPRRSS